MIIAQSVNRTVSEGLAAELFDVNREGLQIDRRVAFDRGFYQNELTAGCRRDEAGR